MLGNTPQRMYWTKELIIINQYWPHLARSLQNLFSFLILSCLHIELILYIIWSLNAQHFSNKITVNLKNPPYECYFIIKLRSHHLSFHLIFKWVTLNCELALSTPTMCRLLQNFLFGSLRARKVKQGGNKYSAHFKLFQVNFFGELKQCIFQLIGSLFLEFLKLFSSPYTWEEKWLSSPTKHISWMVGNKPHLGGQRNIMVCPSLNCCK